MVVNDINASNKFILCKQTRPCNLVANIINYLSIYGISRKSREEQNIRGIGKKKRKKKEKRDVCTEKRIKW